MYREITKIELLEKAERVKNFVLVENYDNRQLIDLATELKSRKSEVNGVYWLDGADSPNYPSFDSIKLPLRFVIKGGEVRAATDGLIFPQGIPVILVIQHFDQLNLKDQEKYIERICKKEKHDYNPHYYLHPESIVILGLNKMEIKQKFSYKVGVTTIKNIL